MIRVRGSSIENPSFKVVSHLYKYSETELSLYLKDKKNLWRALGKLLNEDIDISENEILLKFPKEMFPKVAKIVPFIRKKTRKTPLSDRELERASHLREYRKDIMKQKEPNSVITGMEGAIH